jgi:putative membrane-bound dehydrogenase-like protein
MTRRTMRNCAIALTILALPAAVYLRNALEVPGLIARDGLEATIFAESPTLTNPTVLDVDARGRVWVIEGFNYRTALHPDHPIRPEGDRILILEDTDGDGKSDKETVFYQGRDVDAAMGIGVFGDKVIVSSYEHVFVFTDSNGDDKPDKKEVLFTFGKQNHDHTVHAFVFGPDGRFYFNVGNASEKVMDPQGNVIVDMAGNRVEMNRQPYQEGMVFRTNLDRSGFETLGYNFRNPYEVALDSYGTIWQTDNDDDGNRSVRVNYVMEYGNFGYRDEATGASWQSYRTGMEEEIPRRHWHQGDPGVVPNVMITGAGAPSGLTVYEGSLFPEPFRNTMIHAEAGAREVRGYPLEIDGAGYTGRIESILKSDTDQLFRPVDVAVAPDGSIFVADWFDPGVGGHNVQDQTHGRIMRIAPRGVPYRAAKAPDLSTPELAVAALESPNQETRYLAYTRLAEWKGQAAGALEKEWASANPRFRARALWLLTAIPGQTERWVNTALRDPNPDLRITGLRAARRSGTGVIAAARQLVRDPSPQVRREVAIALHNQTDPAAVPLWVELASQYDGTDRWYLEALGIGADGQWDRVLPAWRAAVGDGWKSPAGRNIVWRAQSDASLPLLAELIKDPGTSEADRLRYFRAFDFQPGAAHQQVLLALLNDVRANPELAALTLSTLDTTAAVMGRPEVRAALRTTLDALRGTPQFVSLAGKYNARDRSDELVQLALSQPDQSLGVDAARLAIRWNGILPFRRAIDGNDADLAWRALTALGRGGGAPASALLEGLVLDPSRPIALRAEAVRVWGQSPNSQARLLALAKEGKVPDELKPAVQQLLLLSFRRQIRSEAEALFGPLAATTADGKTLPAINELASRDGDAAHGKAAFQKACAACHTAGGAGLDFGPGLGEIGSKLGKNALYTAILHPSAGIAFGYEGTVLRLKDGTEAAGIVSSETAGEVQLKRIGGVVTRYPKSEIASRSRLDRSPMPEGLAGTLTEQELVDLVEYLSTLKSAGA